MSSSSSSFKFFLLGFTLVNKQKISMLVNSILKSDFNFSTKFTNRIPLNSVLLLLTQELKILSKFLFLFNNKFPIFAMIFFTLFKYSSFVISIGSSSLLLLLLFSLFFSIKFGSISEFSMTLIKLMYFNSFKFVFSSL